MVKNLECAVPGCDNIFTDEQKNSKMAVCSECEAVKMHLCELCSKKLSPKRIRDGATLCRECEMNPTDLQEGDVEMLEYEEEFESEDFII